MAIGLQPWPFESSHQGRNSKQNDPLRHSRKARPWAYPRYAPGVGWRLDRIPGRRVAAYEIEEQSRYFFPLMVLLNGRLRGESGVWMSRAELEQLHAELCYILGDDWTKDLDCQSPARPGRT